MGKETNQKQGYRNNGTTAYVDDVLNDANAYLLGISQLDAELDFLSSRDTRGKVGHVNKKCKNAQDTNTNMQALNDALEFLCKIADIKIPCADQHGFTSKQTKSPLEELDEALDFLCKIADLDINIKPVIANQKEDETVPVENVKRCIGVKDDESDLEKLAKERAAICRPIKEKKKAKGILRRFFRRLIGRK